VWGKDLRRTVRNNHPAGQRYYSRVIAVGEWSARYTALGLAGGVLRKFPAVLNAGCKAAEWARHVSSGISVRGSRNCERVHSPDSCSLGCECAEDWRD